VAREIYSSKPVPKKITFNLLRKILQLIGKPFYFLFSYSLVFLIFGLYSLGHFVFEIVTFLINKIKNIKIRIPKVQIPKVKPVKLKIKPLQLHKISIKWNAKKFAFFFTILLLLFSFWFFILKGLPSPKTLVTRQREVSTKIYDRNGILLYKIYKNQNRTIVPLSRIPKLVQLATLAAEDAEFYRHPGFSVRGILRAFLNNLKKGKLAGGSTITQQLVKNALLTPEKTLSRKIRELILSIEVEFVFTKDQILEMYLNEVSFGGTAYGIQEASQAYFGKDVEDITLSEAALLAGLPKSPSQLSPFGSNPQAAEERKNEVINLMTINKYITSEEAKRAKDEQLNYVAKRIDIKAPHFVMYVRQLLAEKYGEDTLEKGGLEVTTSLDYQIQSEAEKVVKNEINSLVGYRVSNGAVLVISPSTGEILAMVGSKDYFDIANQGNVNVTLSLRQPGSSIKVVNYAYALGHGFTPATIIDDSPVSFSTPGSPIYSPQNYDSKYRGNIPLRSALAESRNIPAVKVLAQYGVTKMLDLGKEMGITTWTDPSNYGLSLTLGGGDVKLIDLAKVYADIANYGKRIDFVPILKVTDYKGRVLEEIPTEVESKQVLDERIAFQLIDILKDNAARAPAFGFNSALVIKNHPEVAVKTGTSNNLKDNLTLGFNQKYLVAVWVGNNNSSPMSRIASGVTGASPIFNKIMAYLLGSEESIDWPVPDGMVRVNICSQLGTLPCDGCTTRWEWFLKESKPTKTCVVKTPQPTGSNILNEGASISR
jgi:1A family penicillin-binding protein